MAKKQKQHWQKAFPSNMNEIIMFYTNKIVPFRYDGVDLNFHLSQALFSSYEIDPGSRLLLKSIAQKINIDEQARILDIGCGIGTLGLCLKKRYPQCEIHLRDRDALASAFTAYNAKYNKIDITSLSSELGLDQIHHSFDLILSNLPAKAGPSVLQNIINGISDYLSPQGTAAIVIVKTLVQLARETIENAGGELLYVEGTKEHHVFHYRNTKANKNQSFLNLAKRTQKKMRYNQFRYDFTGFFGLKEFDSLHYKTSLALDLFNKNIPQKNLAIWNPGPGHLASALIQKYQFKTIQLAGRDLLELQASEYNLHQNIENPSAQEITIKHLASFFLWEPSCDCLVLFPEEESGIQPEAYILAKAMDILKPGGQLAIISKSANLHRILEHKSGLEIIMDKKHRGHRGVLALKI